MLALGAAAGSAPVAAARVSCVTCWSFRAFATSPAQVIPGAVNGTAYVINNCTEGFFFNGVEWILIAGPSASLASLASLDAAGLDSATAASGTSNELCGLEAGQAGISAGGTDDSLTCPKGAADTRRLLQEQQVPQVYDPNKSPPDRPVSALVSSAHQHAWLAGCSWQVWHFGQFLAAKPKPWSSSSTKSTAAL